MVSDYAIVELRRWMNDLLRGTPDIIGWYVARQLWWAADEYLLRDYNASRCRLRRLENALDRWEKRGLCPWANPSTYELAAQERRRALALGESP